MCIWGLCHIGQPPDANYRDLARALEDATGVPMDGQKLLGLAPDPPPPSTPLRTLAKVSAAGRGRKAAPIKVMLVGTPAETVRQVLDAEAAEHAARVQAAAAAAAADIAARQAAIEAAATLPPPDAPTADTSAAAIAAATSASSMVVKPGKLTVELDGGLQVWDGGEPRRLGSNQVVIPASVLEGAQRAGLDFPYFFELSVVGTSATFRSVVSVLQFTAPDGVAIVAPALLEKLGGASALIDDGVRVWLRARQLPLGTFAAIQPLTEAWHCNVPAAQHGPVLQEQLQSAYQHIGAGDIVEFEYTGIEYAFLVVSVEPADAGAVSLINTELAVDIRRAWPPPQAHHAAPPLPCPLSSGWRAT